MVINVEATFDWYQVLKLPKVLFVFRPQTGSNDSANLPISDSLLLF